MACFIVPAAEAVVVKGIEKFEEKKEKRETAEKSAVAEVLVETEEHKIPLSRKLKWLNYLLIGGAVLLAFEHVWHGEVVPWFPFLTAAGSPDTAAVMLREMATSGTAMAALVTAVWGVICKIADRKYQQVSGSEISEACEAAELR